MKANFAYNIDFVQSHNAKVKIQWFRNGQPIANATKSFYKIIEEDVDTKIKVIAKIENEQNIIAFKETNFEKTIKFGPKLPEIKDINISGDPIIGNKLALSYNYEDLNSGDLEARAKLLSWGNKIIAGENNATYVLTRKDKGHIISAEIEPLTIKGEKDIIKGLNERTSS